jgi:hypothetical protein
VWDRFQGIPALAGFSEGRPALGAGSAMDPNVLCLVATEDLVDIVVEAVQDVVNRVGHG